MSIELYDFQQTSVDRLRENIRQGVMSQLLVAPTGSGKTVIAAHLLAECYRKGKRAVFVADRVALINQTSELLDRYGIPHGVIQGDQTRNAYRTILVASGPTLARRTWPDADLIIVDEAHTESATVRKRIERGGAAVIGLTATPFTKGLGKLYKAVVTVTTAQKLMEEGYLAGFTVYSASAPDMTGARVVAGEWDPDEVEKRTLPIIGDCVAEYVKHGGEKKFIAFGVSIAHCEEMQRQFLEAGVNVALYTSDTNPEAREEIVKEFRKPDSAIRGLISVAALSKGFDVSDVEVVIMCRPLRSSLTEHIQILGRGLRAHPGKEKCLVLDHAGNCMRFWGPMMDFFENGASDLDDGTRKPKAKAEKKEREPFKCPSCAHVHDPRPFCPSCGYEYTRRLQLHREAGELREVGGRGSAPGLGKQDVYSMLLGYSQRHGKGAKWVDWRYKDWFKKWPKGLHHVPKEPNAEVLNFIRYCNISFAKSKGRRAA